MVVIIHQPILTIQIKMKDFFTRGGYSARDPTTDGGEDATNSDTTSGIEPFDLCDNAQDLSIWESNGGESTRPQHSKDCFEEYTGNGGKGCSMDEDCLSKCWMETYGYTKECVVCFVNVHQCSMDNGCMASW